MSFTLIVSFCWFASLLPAISAKVFDICSITNIPDHWTLLTAFAEVVFHGKQHQIKIKEIIAIAITSA
jgi:hypothetical protein